MKNFNFINHENGSEGFENQGLSGLRVAVKSRIGTRSLRNTLLPVLIGTLLLTLGVGQMWGDPYIEAFGIQFYESSSNRYYKTGSEINNNLAFGNKTSDFKIVYIYANAKKNGGNLCGAMYFKWWLVGTDGASNDGGVGQTSNSWSGDYCYEKFGTENGSTALDGINLVQNRRPGNYTFKFFFSFEGNSSNSGCGQWFDCKYSGGDFIFTYTIPDPTITITGANSLVAGTSTNIQASISNYPVGSKITKVRVTGNLASAQETTGSATSLTVNSVTPNASGSNGITVTVTVKFGTGGTKDYTYNYNVSPPAVSSYTVTQSGNVMAGSGTDASPYIISYNGSLTLSLSGATKAATDNNSSSQYSVNGSSWGTTSTYTSITKSNVTSTSKATVNVYARNYNSSASLAGASNKKTITYKAETRYNVTAAKTPSAGGSVTPSSATAMGQYSGGTITATENDGYEFTRWDVTTGSGSFVSATTATTTFKPTAVSTVTATFTPITYNITYHQNGGTGATNTTYNITSSTITLPDASVMSKGGYNFAGWYDNAELEGDPVTTVPTGSYGNKDFYAKWADATVYYTITSGVDASGHGSISDNAGGSSVVAGSNITFTATPDSYYEVEAWYTNAACTEGRHDAGSTTYTISSIDDDATVYVKFQPITYNITYNLNGGSNHGSNPATYTVESSAITLQDPTKTGYDFAGWYDNSSFTGSAVTSIAAGSNGDKAFWAKWTAHTYYVAFDANGGSGSMSNESFSYGTAKALTSNAYSRAGYSFGGWATSKANADAGTKAYNNGQSVNNLTSTDGATVTLWAIWTERPYKIVCIVKPTSWTNIYAYTYSSADGNKKNAAWPGLRLDNNLQGTGLTASNEDACNTYYYKFYTDGGASDAEGNGTYSGGNGSTWNRVIFNNGDNPGVAASTKTRDLNINATNKSTRYYLLTDATNATGATSAYASDWYVRGIFNGNEDWGFQHPITMNCGDNTGVSDAITCAAGTTQFKIYQASTGTWYSASPMTVGVTETLSTPWDDNCSFTSAATSYRFQFNAGTKQLTIVPGTDNDYSATLSINSFGHGSVDPAAGAITLHQYTPTTITATPEVGYRFKQWNITGSVTCSNSTSATATFTATAAGGTIEAEFTQDGIIYFDNTMSQWKGDIYVYLFTNSGTDPWWNTQNNGNGPGIVLQRADNSQVLYNYYGKMTRINNTNYYYFDYHAAGCSGTIYKVVFTKGDYHTSSGLYQTSAAYRTQFNECFPMYMASQTWSTTNSTGYHSTGYWKKYNVTESGFDIRGLNNTWTADLHPFISTTPNSTTFKTTVTLNNATHAFKIYRCSGNPLGNTGTMSPTNHAGWEMTETSDCHIYAPSGGQYEFTINLGSDHIYLSVEYPLLENDYRLLYTGRITTTGSDSHKHPSQSIRHLTGNNKEQKDTVSFWIDKNHKGTINLQYCTNPAANNGKGAWSNVTSGGNPVTVSLSGVSETGIYNFVVTQTTNGSGTLTVTAAPLAENFKYDGELYIRTDASDGGWEAYKYVDNNKLDYSEWARDHSGYDYYHCYFAGTGSNVDFTIANKYSPSLTDTLIADDLVPNPGNLPYQCNVRFMYTSATNKIGRAYLNGSSETGDNEFLVLQGAGSGAQIKKTDGTSFDGNKTKLDDNGNWIYSIDIQADETARVKLISNYRFSDTDHNQYFIGTSDGWSDASTEQILGGDDPTASHIIRVIYDFKTNHLISAWLADGTNVSTEKAIHTSVMIVREHQLDAKQITFTGSGKLKEVDTVYCVMKFNKWTLNNKSKLSGHAALSPSLSIYERGLYWISFPFDVKLNDVFGFGQYGQHWIIEYYDGKTRAQKGFWSESPVNWKYVMPSEKDDYILKANVGYVLALDLDELTESSHVWDYVEDVHLYFPSKDPVHNILQKNVSVDIDQDGYQCTINRTTEGLGPEYDRRIRDSYWHCIGVPSFANNSHTLKHDGWVVEAEPYYPDLNLDDPEGDWTAASLPFYYAWNPETNALAPYSDGGSLTFKAMNSYLVQYSQATMSWTNVTTPSASASIVARKKAKAEDIHFTEFKLELMKGEESMDYTFIRLTDNEEVTSGFEFGHDLCKEFNNGKANIYTFIEDLQVAGNSLPLESEKTTIVPVGVKATAAGEYTFAMPEGTNGIGVTLVDNETGDRTNLAMSDYSVTLNAGTIDGRFVLEISPVAQTPTGIEEVTGDGLQVTGARKVMVDGILYIVKDGKVFDAQGARCK